MYSELTVSIYIAPNYESIGELLLLIHLPYASYLFQTSFSAAFCRSATKKVSFNRHRLSAAVGA
jgi:hypothetical protein